MTDCPHEHFACSVEVTRMENVKKFAADVRIKCADCGLPFQFVGLPGGVLMEGAAVSVDWCEARLAIQPYEAHMTDRELLEYAAKASRAYYTVYGVYPAKIGIYWERLRTMQQSGVTFPVVPLIPATMLVADMPIDELPDITTHHIRFESVKGAGVSWDEVYFASLGPLLDEVMVSGKQVIAMAERRSTRP